MKEVFIFLNRYEGVIYVVAGIAAILYLRKLFQSIQEIRHSVFGLERDLGYRHLYQSISWLVFLTLIIAGEFVFVTFLGVKMVAMQPIATPTVNLQSTETPIISVNPAVTQTPGGAVLTAVPAEGNSCQAGVIEWSDPVAGQEISGLVTLKGTVNTPDFGFYKYEYAPIGSDSWLTIQAGTSPVMNNEIGKWDTSQMTPGDYQLRLIVTDNRGQASAPCIIQVRVTGKQ
jgi:sulfur transfer complex TusBCD TusB component (DsrH family)